MNNLRHGQGSYKYTSSSHSGTVFNGTWVNGKADGAGKLTHGDSHDYQGSWQDDLMIGPGKYIFSFGAEQHGEYVPVEQEQGTGEDDGEDVKVKMISKWRAHKITSLTVDAAQIV